MRDDVKRIIENTNSWKENFAEDPIETKEMMPASASIAAWRKRDPLAVDLYSAYVMAKDQGDNETAGVVMEMINQYEKEKL